jgi:hypothetical protein
MAGSDQADTKYEHLQGNTDALAWAEAFMDLMSRGEIVVDEALMLTWFANAIMAGFDEGYGVARKEAARDHQSA